MGISGLASNPSQQSKIQRVARSDWFLACIRAAVDGGGPGPSLLLDVRASSTSTRTRGQPGSAPPRCSHKHLQTTTVDANVVESTPISRDRGTLQSNRFSAGVCMRDGPGERPRQRLLHQSTAPDYCRSDPNAGGVVRALRRRPEWLCPGSTFKAAEVARSSFNKGNTWSHNVTRQRALRSTFIHPDKAGLPCHRSGVSVFFCL